MYTIVFHESMALDSVAVAGNLNFVNGELIQLDTIHILV